MAHIVVQVRDAHAGLGAARWGYAWRGAACLGAAWPAEAPQGLVHNEGEWTTPEFESPAPARGAACQCMGMAGRRMASAVRGAARAPQDDWQSPRFEAWASTLGGSGQGSCSAGQRADRHGMAARVEPGHGEQAGGRHAPRFEPSAPTQGWAGHWQCWARQRSTGRGLGMGSK